MIPIPYIWQFLYCFMYYLVNTHSVTNAACNADGFNSNALNKSKKSKIVLINSFLLIVLIVSIYIAIA